MNELSTHQITCLCCNHPLAAKSRENVQAAMQDHVDYVNETADRQTDPHFEDARRDALVTR